MVCYSSPTFKAKDEKRPWILRAREDSIEIPSRTTQEESRSLPQTLIYISCGWESFKDVLLDLIFFFQNGYLNIIFDFIYQFNFIALIGLQNCMALLSSKAWHLSKAHGFNFFPGTQRYVFFYYSILKIVLYLNDIAMPYLGSFFFFFKVQCYNRKK